MINVSIIGISGYTGEELLKILSRHHFVKIISCGARGETVGKKISQIYPDILGDIGEVKCIPAEDISSKSDGKPDIVFLALPHGEAASFAYTLLKDSIKVIDLSADFRLKDPAVYSKWYKIQHPHPEIILDNIPVYGLPELYRNEIKKAALVANPGCYPTTVILGLAPLIKAASRGELQIDLKSIIVDSKSGISGAGRKPARQYFESEHPNHRPYNIGGTHRHIPEMEQELNILSGKPDEDIKITFTPSIIPVERGMLSIIYVNLINTSSSELESIEDKLLDLYSRFYQEEPFTKVLPKGELPSIKNVVGTNLCQIGVAFDKRTSRILIISAIDNLIKGASGQAVQNMNIMFGFDEKEGLE